jgi:hypothetical protein
MIKKALAIAASVLAFSVVSSTGGPQSGPSTTAKSRQDSLQPPAASAADVLKRAGFSSAVVDREPFDDLDSLDTSTDKVFFFTEIVGMEGRTFTHRWIYNDETMADVLFEIGGPRWRVYSSKNLVPGWVGTWRVQVLDDEGNTLHEDSFVYHHGS